MPLFKRLFGRKAQQTEQKSQSSEIVWPIPSGSFLEQIFSGQRVTAEKAMSYYRQNSTIATSVDMIADKVEQIKPVLKKNGTEDIVVKHPLLDLLQMPNPFETWNLLIGSFTRHYLLKHDAFLSMVGNINRPPLELYVPKLQNVHTIMATDYRPASYTVTIGDGRGAYQRVEKNRRVRFIDGNLKEFYHLMGFSSRGSNIEGDSPLEAAALEAKQQIKGRYHNLGLLENGGRLSLIVSFNEADGIDDDVHKDRKRRINEDLSGPENAGGIAVISGEEMKVTEVGINNKDMDFATLDTVAANAIYLRYGIPLPLVSLDASTFNNVENALFNFFENTILPVTNTIFSGLSKILLPRYGIDDMHISYDPESIDILIRQKLQEIKVRREINIETVNELRALLPHRESIENGDTLYQNATLVPLGDDLYTDDNLSAEERAALLSADAGTEND